MSAPVAAKQFKALRGKRDVAILRSFSAMDMNEHSLGVDISDLKAQRFLETEPAGVDCRKESVVMEGFDMRQKLKDLGLAQNTGQPSFLLGP
jgi:hypothetical protein